MIRVKDTNEHADAIKLKVVKLASKMFRSRGVKDVKMDDRYSVGSPFTISGDTRSLGW